MTIPTIGPVPRPLLLDEDEGFEADGELSPCLGMDSVVEAAPSVLAAVAVPLLKLTVAVCAVDELAPYWSRLHVPLLQPWPL